MDFVIAEYNSNHAKSEEKYVVKVFNWSEVHLSEMTCYKIHTLEMFLQINFHHIVIMSAEPERFFPSLLLEILFSFCYPQEMTSDLVSFSKKY